MRFQNRVALITGGGRGIGAATAHKLAGEGAAIAIADMDLAPAEETAEAIRAAGGRALATACDVTSRADVEAAFDRAVAELGQIDVLVACAGILRDNLFFRMSDDDWDSVIATHLRGSFLAAQVAQKHMVPRRSGKIVFLSSISALGNRGQANYATAKMGLQGLTRTLAIELGQFNINVNAVAPGWIDTRMTRGVAERLGVAWEQLEAQLSAEVPLKRIGQPEDVANVIAFLASDEASYVSGQTIYAAGGPRG